ncbi:MAG: TonB-dependent receptor, partial [Ktedonobacteraceae bacterium]|nr:TonB-dependent receptor [Ktedonobacteraceae bacterium]
GLSFSDSYLGLQGATPLVPNTSQATSQISHDTNGSAAAIVSKVIASHSLRFGFEGLLERYNAANPLSGLGTFNFTRQFTQKNSVNTTVGGDASSGNPIASLLLGYPSSGNYSAQVSYAIQQPYAALFIQDNWKARRNLTLNLGLRWDYQAPYTERNNQLNTGFCTTCVNPLQNSVSGLNLLGGLEFISSGSRHYYPSELHDWQPRLGISYAITPRVVFHGGIGLTYINSMESPFGQGFNATTNYIATNDNTTPLTSIANPFPTGTVQPSGSSLGLATLVGQNLNFIAPGYVRPGLLQWSASLQTRLPGNIVLQPAYVANRVYHWEINKDINALPAQYNLGTTDNVTYLQAMVPNPMAGLIPNNATLNARMIQRQNLLKPFPEFGTLTEMYIPAGGSRYDALQVTVTKPLSHGLSVRSSFTMSHQIDSFQYMNPTDSAPEWYKDPNPNRLLTMAIMYSLPGLTATPRFVRSVLGGWQFNSALRRYNGLLVANPANVTQLSDPRISDPTYGRYFNTCYLDATGKMVMTAPNRPACDSTSSIPAFKLNNSFTLNTLGPNMTGVRARGGTRLDASLFKVFKIHEQTTFELRAEFFNALNSPVYGIPNLSPGNAAYGKISLTQQNDPRLGQLTVRINF